MEKVVSLNKVNDTMQVEILMTYNEYLEFQTFMNMCCFSKEWEVYNKLTNNVPFSIMKVLDKG
jgi:hypothetical protein